MRFHAAGVLGLGLMMAALAAGCGQVPGTPSAVGREASVAAAGRQETQLYGAYFKGRITALKPIPVTEDSSERRHLSRITLDVEKPNGDRLHFYHGKLIVVAALTAEDLGLKVGDRVSGFANYPIVNEKTRTFVNQPGRAPFVSDLKKI